MKKVLFLLAISTLLYACGQKAADNEFVVNGTISNYAEKDLLVNKVEGGQLLPIDSIKTDKDGKFSYTGEIEFTDYFLFMIPQTNSYIQLLPSGGEVITLTADGADLNKTYKVSGSTHSELLQQLNYEHYKHIAQVDSLGQIYRASMESANMDSLRQSLDKAYAAIVASEKDYLKSFIDKNTTSLASLFALYQQLAPRQPIFDLIEDMEYFEKVAAGLTPVLPNSSLVQNLNTLINENKNLPPQVGMEGTEVPDISLSDPNGKVVKLSSLRGKYVLLDFWAGWCRPCRQENPNLVANYKKYNKDGFEIYQVSLDKTKEEWVDAIKKDNLTWLHVSDLQYWQSAAAQQYGISSIPASFLLDKEGKVIARNLRGEALGLKLAEIFGH